MSRDHTRIVRVAEGFRNSKPETGAVDCRIGWFSSDETFSGHIPTPDAELSSQLAVNRARRPGHEVSVEADTWTLAERSALARSLRPSSPTEHPEFKHLHFRVSDQHSMTCNNSYRGLDQ